MGKKFRSTGQFVCDNCFRVEEVESNESQVYFPYGWAPAGEYVFCCSKCFDEWNHLTDWGSKSVAKGDRRWMPQVGWVKQS